MMKKIFRLREFIGSLLTGRGGNAGGRRRSVAPGTAGVIGAVLVCCVLLAGCPGGDGGNTDNGGIDNGGTDNGGTDNGGENGGNSSITDVESGEFTSEENNDKLIVTLTGGTYVASPTIEQFTITTAGTGGFANVTDGSVVRTSDTQVTIVGLTPVTAPGGSGQKITVAAAAQSTQAASVTVEAATLTPVNKFLLPFSTVLVNEPTELVVRVDDGDDTYKSIRLVR